MLMNTMRSNLLVRLGQMFLVLVIGAMVLLPFAQPAAAKGCAAAPTRPRLQYPVNYTSVHTRNVDLAWGSADCAQTYSVEVRQDIYFGRPVDAMYNLHTLHYTTHRLAAGTTYWWIVQACNSN